MIRYLLLVFAMLASTVNSRALAQGAEMELTRARQWSVLPHLVDAARSNASPYGVWFTIGTSAYDLGEIAIAHKALLEIQSEHHLQLLLRTAADYGDSDGIRAVMAARPVVTSTNSDTNAVSQELGRALVRQGRLVEAQVVLEALGGPRAAHAWGSTVREVAARGDEEWIVKLARIPCICGS